MGVGLSSPLVYLSILVIAVCGIIYELIIGAVSSYLWGDSIYYFSVTIGLYMSAMGLGAFVSKFIKRDLFDWLEKAEREARAPGFHDIDIHRVKKIAAHH